LWWAKTAAALKTRQLAHYKEPHPDIPTNVLLKERMWQTRFQGFIFETPYHGRDLVEKKQTDLKEKRRDNNVEGVEDGVSE